MQALQNMRGSVTSLTSMRERWDIKTTNRPAAEPPILDYRKFEEGGQMYHSLHRHAGTNPEQWYAYTDAEIERDLLGDYHSWMHDARLDAKLAGKGEKVKFYEDLSPELDIDREEPEMEFNEVERAVVPLERPSERREETWAQGPWEESSRAIQPG